MLWLALALVLLLALTEEKKTAAIFKSSGLQQRLALPKRPGTSVPALTVSALFQGRIGVRCKAFDQSWIQQGVNAKMSQICSVIPLTPPCALYPATQAKSCNLV